MSWDSIPLDRVRRALDREIRQVQGRRRPGTPKADAEHALQRVRARLVGAPLRPYRRQLRLPGVPC